MSILSLDLGTKMGWAIFYGDLGAPLNVNDILNGVIEFRPGRFEGGGMRWLRFRRWLDTMHKASKISQICFEEVRGHKGVDAAHIYGGFLSHLTAWAEKEEIPYEGIPVGTIKRHVTGKGNANKQAVITAVQKRGFSPTDDNDADALALLVYVLERDQ